MSPRTHMLLPGDSMIVAGVCKLHVYDQRANKPCNRINGEGIGLQSKAPNTCCTKFDGPLENTCSCPEVSTGKGKISSSGSKKSQGRRAEPMMSILPALSRWNSAPVSGRFADCTYALTKTKRAGEAQTASIPSQINVMYETFRGHRSPASSGSSPASQDSCPSTEPSNMQQGLLHTAPALDKRFRSTDRINTKMAAKARVRVWLRGLFLKQSKSMTPNATVPMDTSPCDSIIQLNHMMRSLSIQEPSEVTIGNSTLVAAPQRRRHL